jgi:hypothetical protein
MVISPNGYWGHIFGTFIMGATNRSQLSPRSISFYYTHPYAAASSTEP